MSWMVTHPIEDIIVGGGTRRAYPPVDIPSPYTHSAPKAHSQMSIPMVCTDANLVIKQRVERTLLEWKHARERGEKCIEYDNGFLPEVEQILRKEGFRIEYFPAQSSRGRGFYRLTKPGDDKQQPITYMRFE